LAVFHHSSVAVRPSRLAYLVALCALALPGVSYALDKVDPYICPTAARGSGIECFLEAVPQTYTMCRQIKSIEIIEFGLTGAQEGVNGAKTESCIDKHKLTMARPYEAALREAARSKEQVEHLRELYDFWLESLLKLKPASNETDEGYKQRVARPYGEFNEQTKAITVLVESPRPSAVVPVAHKKKKKTKK